MFCRHSHVHCLLLILSDSLSRQIHVLVWLHETIHQVQSSCQPYMGSLVVELHKKGYL